jgi:hypothetical protein
VKVWLVPLAEQELIEGALYHARSASALLDNAFVLEIAARRLCPGKAL